jgi:hypothetical protein
LVQRRRRHLRRNTLIFLGSLLTHAVVFYLANSEFQFYQLPEANEPAVQVEIVPEKTPPPPPFPLITPKLTPKPQPPSPQPTPAPQPQPAPTPQPTTPQVSIVKAPPAAPTPAPAKVAATPAPAPKPAPAPTPLAPTAQPAPPQPAPSVTLTHTAPKTVSAPKIVLHRPRDETSGLEPPISIPGAVFAPSPSPSTTAPPAPPSGALPGGGSVAGLPSGQLPGFGGGLKGGRLGCLNAVAAHLSAEQQARCTQAYGEGARETPVLDPLGTAKRAELDREAAQEAASQKYRDTTVGGTLSSPTPGQPKILQKPSE